MNRRDLLKIGTASLIASQLPWPLRQLGNQAFAGVLTTNPSLSNAADAASPLLNFGGPFGAGKFLGDNEAMPHDILWNKVGFLAKLGGIPKPSLACDLVVVGGGIAGLLAAHRASQKDVILLEQDPRFGGNSKGEIYNGPRGKNMMSQGAAYICKPEPGDSSDTLLKELGLTGRVEEGAPYLLKSLLNDNVWAGSEVGAKAQKDLARVEAKLREIFETEFPEIPFSRDAQLTQKTLKLDQLNFEQWLKSEFGELDPFVLEYLQIYCWSSFNASTSELSAAQALNFIAAEVDGVLALPGGNAAIAEGLYRAILAKRGESALRANSFVVDIKVLNDRVQVCTFESGKLITIEAKNAIFAAPKFFAKTVIDGLPSPLEKAFASIPYRAYLVANVQLKSPLVAPHYDVFSLEGSFPDAPTALRPSPRAYTDAVFADWAGAAAQMIENPVLTVYRPLPTDGARQFLFSETALEKHSKIIAEGLGPMLRALGLSTAALGEMRMSRWGHAVPVARQGLLASGVPQTIEAAFGTRLQFVGQDVWANPAFETAVTTTERALENLLSR